MGLTPRDIIKTDLAEIILEDERAPVTRSFKIGLNRHVIFRDCRVFLGVGFIFRCVYGTVML